MPYLKKLVNALRWSGEALEDLPVFYHRLTRKHLWSFNFGKNMHFFSKTKLGCEVDLIIDVGANKGQFATMARFCWPQAIIESFEPNPDAAKEFSRNLCHDKKICLHQIALAEYRIAQSGFWFPCRLDEVRQGQRLHNEKRWRWGSFASDTSDLRDFRSNTHRIRASLKMLFQP